MMKCKDYSGFDRLFSFIGAFIHRATSSTVNETLKMV